MLSTIVGLVLLVLGIACYVVALWVWFKTSIKAPDTRISAKDRDMADNAKAILEAAAKLLEQFAKLTVPVQFALLGTLWTGAGLYILANKPLG